MDSNSPSRKPSLLTSNPGTTSNESNFSLQAPTINLPKGGGAIRGMGEKFSANPVTGTGSMSIPIAVSPGRSGFSPQLSLTYDSGSGNGLFGFGWSLSLPQITRKTDKGLPEYRDDEESDVFILSGAEDLVPALEENGKDYWIPDNFTWEDYQIRRYRPRIEGLFALIERWSKTSNPAEVHWRTISKDNVLTIYGKDNNSRISDPLHPERIFSWLICETRDDKGNGIVYHYQEDDGTGVKLSQAHERNRGAREDSRRRVNRYIRSIKYGNRNTLLEGNGVRPNGLSEETLKNADWMFEVVFDYDEHRITELADTHVSVPASSAWEVSNPRWQMRPDPFSSYRAGFEVRTTRRCQRVLMFHHFQELDREDNKDLYTGLVRSTDFTYTDSNNNRVDPNNAIYSFIKLVTQSSYQKASGDEYYKKSLPPVEFIYSESRIQDDVYELRGESLENLPVGIDGVTYQWVDLDGEGPSGILTEQAGAWFYKRNLSPINEIRDGINVRLEAKFAPVELVAAKPMFSLDRQTQFLDLAGDGRPDVVQFGSVTPGFFERTMDKGWESFVAFRSLPTLDWDNPNLKFIDLDGDGHADILISEDNVFTWYPSLAEKGFDSAERVAQAWDEEKGPRIVFADGTQSIYLSDMSGDGLTDIVRIRNGEVCYWPNLGYGHFGAKVTMDGSPWFDHPDLFDQKRIRLVDIDGSGTTDILYLGSHKIDIYFNLSGNGWSASHPLTTFPRIDNLASVQAFDLLGNGTACLVWGSPLPGDASRPMRYIKLMGDQKPHLLTTVKNNLGAETSITYAPSTKFYLQDRLAGNPWIAKLPFPVHCVEKVTAKDYWRNTEFTTTYSYHHGYFDGPEREFRGFGRVEQVDIEDYDSFQKGNIASPYITDDYTLYQPPIKTITWFHTGAAGDRQRILKQFEREYFYNRFPKQSGFAEKPLPEPDFAQQDLTAEEWREALRACKGMMLRQEVYELKVDPLVDSLPDKQKEERVRIFSAATHNCHIQRLQPTADNRHAVFLVTESEALTYHYELDLSSGTLEPDPRIAHTLNLRHDEYGNPQQSIAVMYPRVRQETDPGLKDYATLINMVQSEMHVAYTETRYTDDVLLPPADPRQPNQRTPLLHHRLCLPCEVLTYELTGLPDPTFKPNPADRYFSIEYLRQLKLSSIADYKPVVPAGEKAIELTPLLYHKLPKDKTPHQRLVEHARTLFFDDFDGSKPLTESLNLGRLGIRGLKYEDYKLALTKALLDAIFIDQSSSPTTLPKNKLEWKTTGNETALSRLDKSAISGYLSLAGDKERAEKAGINDENEYWMRSGVAGFADDAAEHFYLPEEYTDPFGNLTTLEYDPRDLYIQSSSDARKNTTKVVHFDYRVLAPREMQDINGNLTEVAFDVMGMVVAVAIKGKGTEADNLDDYNVALVNPSPVDIHSLFDADICDRGQAFDWLGNATARFVYHFGEERNNQGEVIKWMDRPAGACGIQREQHFAQNKNSLIQIALECSDGSGNVIMKKMQAESAENKPGARWIVSGKTVLNNKGKPVKQYEPYFTSDFGCTEVDEEGVTPVMYYDAPGRLIRTEMPDGRYSRVEFSPWHTKTFDANDTVGEPDNAWYARNAAGTAAQQRAASLALGHANTPAITILDSLGREVIAIAHNKTQYGTGTVSVDRYVTFSKLDAEGKPLWIRDARENIVMRYTVPTPTSTDVLTDCYPTYDIAGNLLYQHSMDAGDRWMLMDAAGKPMLAWDINVWDEGNRKFSEHRLYYTEYDKLHRPMGQWLNIDGRTAQKIEHFEYRDGDTTARSANLNGQLVKHYDPSGLTETIERDFKSNVKEVRRRLNDAPTKTLIDWSITNRDDQLAETFIQTTEYDALNRMTVQYNWHREGKTGAVYTPVYNQRGILKSETLSIRGGTATDAIKEIRYNAKGQMTYLELGNDTITEYTYDKDTFRLTRLVTTRPTNDTVQDLAYTYDPVGNITEITDAAFEPVFFKNQQVRPRSRYIYDALYRLIEAEGRENCTSSDVPTHQEGKPQEVQFPIQPIQPSDPKALRNYRERYIYDEVGNFVQMRHIAHGGRWTRTYDPDKYSNRLLKININKPTAVTTYTYDTHGNMLNIANVDPGQQLRWDHRDMIGSLNLGTENNWAYYQYDAGKQRTRKQVVRTNSRNVTTVEERIYLGGYELYRRYVGSSTKPVEEIESHHLFEGEQRVLLVDDVITSSKGNSANPRPDGLTVKKQTLFRYQYSNHLGSACLELAHDAEIISYEEYHPYGTSAYRAMKRGIEAPPKRYRYTGMERDEESGLNYHTARCYAPWLGRWVSCDPIKIGDGLNVYKYSGDHPISNRDRNGKAAGNVSRQQNIEPQIIQIKPQTEAKPQQAKSLNNDYAGPTLSKGTDLPKWKIDPELLRYDNFNISEQDLRDWVRSEAIPNSLVSAMATVNTEEHDLKVTLAINFFITQAQKTLAKSNPDATRARILIEARGLSQSLRDDQNLERSSESLILRDAEKYLWGRSGLLYFAKEAQQISPSAAKLLRYHHGVSVGAIGVDPIYTSFKQSYRTLNNALVHATGRGVLSAKENKPLSTGGGMEWFRMGLDDYAELDMKSWNETQVPSLFRGPDRSTFLDRIERFIQESPLGQLSDKIFLERKE